MGSWIAWKPWLGPPMSLASCTTSSRLRCCKQSGTVRGPMRCKNQHSTVGELYSTQLAASPTDGSHRILLLANTSSTAAAAILTCNCPAAFCSKRLALPGKTIAISRQLGHEGR
jgi:hypothetical protein